MKSASYRSNAIWMFFQAVAQRLVGAVSTIVLARLMTPAGLGVYSVTAATANAGYGVLRFGIDAGTHVLAAGEDVERSEVLGDTLSASLVAFLVIGVGGALSCFILSELVATALFRNSLARPYVQVGGILLLGQVMAQAAYTIFAGLHRFAAYVRVMLVGAPAIAGAAIAGALWAGALGAAILAALAQLAVSFVLVWTSICTARAIGVRISLRLPSGSLKRILQVGFPFYLAGLIYIPADYLIQGLMARVHGFGSLGDLRVVLAITTIVSFLPNAIGGPMISAFSRAHQGPDGVGDVYWRTMRVVWAVALSASLVLGIAWALLVDVFGAGYRDARSIGFVALAYAVTMCLRNVWSNRLLSSRRRMLLVFINTVEAAVFAITALLLVPRLGLAGYLVAQTAGATAPLLGAVAAAVLRARRDEAQIYVAGGAISVLGLALVAWFNLGAAPLSVKLPVAIIGGLALAGAWSVTMVTGAERRAVVVAVNAALRWRG